MVDVITGIYDFTLPEVGGSDDTWGDKLNANWAKMETLLATAFANGSPARLGYSLRLDGAGALNLGQIDLINALDGSAQQIRFGRSSTVGNMALVLYDPGTSTVRVVLDSAGTGKVTAGIGDFGNIFIGALVDGTPSTNTISTPAATQMQFRSGLASGVVYAFRADDGTALATIDTGANTATTIMTQTKGDARYAQLGVSNIFAGASLTIENASPQLRWHETDQTSPAGRFRIWSLNNVLYVDRNTSTPTEWQTATTIASFALEGTAVPNTHTVITQQKGDARYLNLTAGSGNVVTGALYVGSGVTGQIVLNGTTNNYLDTIGTSITVRDISGTVTTLAVIQPAGTAILSTKDVITAEKGDARYLNLTAGQTNQLTGEITSASGGVHMRLKSGTSASGYGVLHYSDTNNYFMMLTNNNDANGSFNALRPFNIAKATGVTTINNIKFGNPGLGYIDGTAQAMVIAGLGIVAFRLDDPASANIARIGGGGTPVGTTDTIITREKGDARYSLASAQRFKTGIAVPAPNPLLAAFGALTPKTWVWGGDTPEEDERYGTIGMGFIAEEVEPVLPAAVRHQWVPGTEPDEDGSYHDTTEKRVHGLDPLALIAVLWAKVQQQEARIAVLEGA